ncbi:MAG: response regulator [Phycisphaerae bacterium]
MKSSSTHAADPRAMRNHPKWYRLYFVLAAFDVLTVCVSLSMNHRLMDMYETSVEANRVWADRLASYAHLNAIAAEANAPGNDVFESRDADEASARLDAKLADFAAALDAARKELRDSLTPERAAALLPYLDDAAAAMRIHVAEARSIFAHVRSHDMTSAGEKMAVMDRAFYGVTASLVSLGRDVQSLHQDELEEQATAATAMRRTEHLLAALVVIMVSLAVLYGHKLARRAKVTDRRLRDLARDAREHAARADRHNEALANALTHVEMQRHAMDEHTIVAITDPSGEIIYANDKFCDISKYARDELIGQSHRIVNSGHHPRAFFADLWGTIKRGDVWHGEICNRAKDGALYWVDSTIVPFKDDTGRITQYVAIRTDITARKESEDELRRAKAAAEAADLAKSEFLANMSHEIRTPMTAILGFAENIAGNVTDPANVAAIATVRRNGEYLLHIINDSLDLSKIEAGKTAVEQIPCKPCEIIAEVASLVRVRADAKGLAFNIEYIGAIPATILSDPIRLRQILINLIGNAIKFTENGAVRLIVRLVRDLDGDQGHGPEQPYLQFDILDTGIGMSDEQAAILFRPFTQADTSTTRTFGGTGLGLTISKRFAELLGGGITMVKSELGVGTRFRAIVATGPLDGVAMIEDPMSATRVADSGIAVAKGSRTDLCGCRILLAEDGPDNQRLISFVLEKAGAHVTVEANGKRALDAALAARDDGKPFHVILMDMQMPVMDGYSATRQLRDRNYTAPIIALTAHAMGGDRDKCLKAGCDDYATKPIHRERLIKVIHHHWACAEATSVAVV